MTERRATVAVDTRTEIARLQEQLQALQVKAVREDAEKYRLIARATEGEEVHDALQLAPANREEIDRLEAQIQGIEDLKARLEEARQEADDHDAEAYRNLTQEQVAELQPYVDGLGENERAKFAPAQSAPVTLTQWECNICGYMAKSNAGLVKHKTKHNK